MDSRRLSSVDEANRIREKHQSLLQDYLVLQKDCVSKKRKLKEANERKETLLDEIRFLKQRRNLLMKTRTQDSQKQQEFVPPQKPPARYEAGPSGRFASTSTKEPPAFQNPQLTLGSIWNSGIEPKEDSGFAAVKVGKKPKDVFGNGKRADKRKITWQDQLALKV